MRYKEVPRLTRKELLETILAAGASFALSRTKTTPTLEAQSGPNDPALRIDEKTIPYSEYNEILQYEQFAGRNTRQKAIELTNLQFIKNVLSKKELEANGYPFSEDAFQTYIREKKYNIANTPFAAGLRLEYENHYLRDQIYEHLLSWYSGHFFHVDFENVLLEIPQEEKNQRARAKIEEIRAKWVGGTSSQDLFDEYKEDEEIKTLNWSPGFTGGFAKMNVTGPEYSSPELLEIIQELPPGEISEIFIMSDPRRGTPTPVPFGFAVVRVTKAHVTGISSYTALLENAKSNTQIEVFVE